MFVFSGRFFLEVGGIRAAARYHWSRIALKIGFYRRYRNPDWSRVTRLVFVCSGNVCRSPYGAERARSLGVPAVSCGTSAIEGAPADPAAVRLAALRSVALELHRSHPVAGVTVAPGDLIVAAEPHHAQAFDSGGLSGAQVTLLGIWAGTPAAIVPDPFGKTDRCFQFVFKSIDDALNSMARNLRKANR
jgi:protein-tyrosine phosphatase